MTQYRQGDVLIERIDEIPQGAEKVALDNGRAILAYGEATGHAHALNGDEAELYKLPANDNLFLRVVKENAFVRHEEHTRIPLPPGNYRITRQREYDDSEEVRYVAD